MKLLKFSGVGLITAVMVFNAGCSWFDSSIPKEGSGQIPGAAADPGNDLTIEGGNTGKWASGAGPGSLSGKAGEWTPVAGVSFPAIYFAYDQDVIGVSERAKLERVSRYLRDNSELGLIVEGNCDDRGTAEYNRALGERRAMAVKNYLGSLGIAASRVKTISYGEDRPAVKGNTAQARAKNRRAELVPAKMK